MADRHSENEPIDLEELPCLARHVVRLLGRVELVFCLNAKQLAATIHNECRDLPPRVRVPLHPQDDRDAMSPRHLADSAHHSLLLGSVEGRHLEVEPAQAGQIGLRETHDAGAPARRIGDAPLDSKQSILDGVRDAR